ncbi:MAG: ATP-binding protein, partial [Myxococcota bacterium]
VWGAPGVGKSALARQVCQKLGIGFKDVRLAQREPIDVRGLPVPIGDQVHWLLPAEWPREGRGIIMFDELTAADRTLQVAAYEFILDRRLGDTYKVPDGWYIMAAGNRTSDRAVSTRMSSALANRFCHVDVACDVEEWVRYAQDRGLHPDVLAFLRYKPELLLTMAGNLERGWPSPRSWERVAAFLHNNEGLTAHVERLQLCGLVGAGAATEFAAFRSMSIELPNILEVFQGRRTFSPPTRADQKYATCLAVAYHVWRYPDQERAINTLFDVGDKLPSDFASMLMIDVLRADTAKKALVLGNRRFKAWSDRHGAAFAEKYRPSAPTPGLRAA